MRTRILMILVATGTLMKAPVALADGPTIEEVRFIQKLKMVGDIAGQVQVSVAESKGEVPSLSRYASELIAFQLKKVQGWKVPAPEVRPLYNQLIKFLSSGKILYAAYARGDINAMKNYGKQFEVHYSGLDRAWKRVLPRYEGQ